jgi:HSP20 family molecular chaperone IbpA
VGGKSLLRGPQSMAVDVYDTDDSLVVETTLPGASPYDVDISIVGNTLTIKGEIECEEETEEKGKHHCSEGRYGAFLIEGRGRQGGGGVRKRRAQSHAT